MDPRGKVGVHLQQVQLGLERVLCCDQVAIPANSMEAIVDFLYKDDCGAVTKSEDREYVADVGLHRGGLPLVSRDGEAGTGTYQQGKGPRANSKSGPIEYSTSVQCTGTGRSTAHSRNVMYNTPHSQHLENSEFDSLHDVSG